jgi:fatty acid amide hydrolase 2
MRDLLRLPAVELAVLVKKREVKPIELVDEHIRAILEWNPFINALVANRFEDARREAKRMTSPSDLPLYGVPFTAKESLGVEGMPQTSGSTRRKHRVAQRTATAVQRVMDAGAICLGVTNIPEMAMWMETDNKIYGRTNNPHDLHRTPGGSSGGEAAIVAAGASPFGVGTDVGGSIRQPAFFCGVFGHKASGGLVPCTGHLPAPSAGASRFVSTGPLCRSARDLHTILDVIVGPDELDPGCTSLSLHDPREVRINDLKIFLIPDDGKHVIAPSLRTALARSAAALKARGATVVETKLPELANAFAMWGDSLRVTSDRTFESWLGDGEKVSIRQEVVRAIRGRSAHTLPALTFMALERASNYVNFTRGGRDAAVQLRMRIEEMLGDNGVILFPPFDRTAPLHGSMLFRPSAFVLCGIWSVLEMCATAIPVGHDSDGLPCGVQAIAPNGRDHNTLAVALALEDDLGGWTQAKSPGKSFATDARSLN